MAQPNAEMPIAIAPRPAYTLEELNDLAARALREGGCKESYPCYAEVHRRCVGSLKKGVTVQEAADRIIYLVQKKQSEAIESAKTAEGCIAKSREKMADSRLRIQNLETLLRPLNSTHHEDKNPTTKAEKKMEIDELKAKIRFEEQSMRRTKKFIKRAMFNMLKDLEWH